MLFRSVQPPTAGCAVAEKPGKGVGKITLNPLGWLQSHAFMIFVPGTEVRADLESLSGILLDPIELVTTSDTLVESGIMNSKP